MIPANSLFRRFDCWALVLWLLICSGKFITPHDPRAQDFRTQALSGFSWQHPLGVDGLGRDFASRLWEGAAHTLLFSFAALCLTLLLASVLLILERSTPPFIAALLRRMVAFWIAFPVVFIGLLLLVFLPPSPWTLVLAAGVGNLAFAFRQLRVFWLSIREALFVKASEVLGARGWPLLRRVILPNLLPEITALARLLLAVSALELSGLAFLGLIGDPDFTELGAILKQNQAYLFQAPFLVVLPGLMLSLLLLSVHLTRFHRQ